MKKAVVDDVGEFVEQLPGDLKLAVGERQDVLG